MLCNTPMWRITLGMQSPSPLKISLHDENNMHRVLHHQLHLVGPESGLSEFGVLHWLLVALNTREVCLLACAYLIPVPLPLLLLD